ncbi:lysozyme [Serratia rhizosphaerae]|uniref:lysozyme n=1 Tax=unclassified Serratia (in: enterobacteria) TaxID=2647522 RepID=UPI000CF6B473|nr:MULTISPECIES: lysozyme [unclassified Serratia (in: enterobacteria)]MBU3893483.1 lysozyme [Serratia rubidaea]AVJ16364.1 glycoside hydrolase [Serratia sp. MYb239]MCA4821971.1 lysozyme [Serratia rubidaea]QNK31691.1 lysozyme [Serratia sp. JUb9]QPT14379.1 lysozyme [Serratia rubidaea]
MNPLLKRCSAVAILALAATLPQFGQLHTSERGLRLIADFEGCQLSPYQCSANVWTNGIGHTAGVKPNTAITERQAAANLLDDVRNVEKGIARCMSVDMPQPVYDAVSAFAFNVGVGAACRSTLAGFIKQRRWQQACDQLPRWVYVNGVKSKGLERRRQAERALCLQGVSP